jgi:hypothetical protein
VNSKKLREVRDHGDNARVSAAHGAARKTIAVGTIKKTALNRSGNRNVSL